MELAEQLAKQFLHTARTYELDDEASDGEQDAAAGAEAGREADGERGVQERDE